MEQVLKSDGQDPTANAPRRGSNQSGMRASNERLVLSLIRETGALPKAEIARRTGLSAQTVSVIIRALEADGLLERGTPVRGKIGQPSVPMRLAKEGAFFFGLKIGRRSLDLVLTNFVGEVQDRVHVSHAYPTPDHTIRFTGQAIDQILSNLPPEHHARIAGIGIALPFQLWDWAEHLGTGAEDMAEWQGRDIAAEIGAQHDFPIFTCNDASTACGAELVFGDQNKPRDFLYVFVGFFIGGGLVLDGTVYTGTTGNAAALGSIPVPGPDGALHQLVDVASLAVLENALHMSGDANTMIWDTPTSWTVPDAPLDIWLTNAARGIAHAILSSVCLIDVNHVLIDGWMPRAMRAQLVRRVQQHLKSNPVAGIQTPHVSEGTVGSDARALGAASLPLSKRFLSERNSYLKGPSI